VHIAERKMTSAQVIILGTILCGLSFIMLVLPGKYLVLYVSMFVLCISEILVMPFVATVTVQRSGATNRGAYMGFGALAYSAAHIVSPYLGTRVADFYGFDTLWIGTGVLTVFIAFGFYVIMKKM